jgi:peptide/nickel transport system substrate-binding protein/microcin C transport system substrate-binding protein
MNSRFFIRSFWVFSLTVGFIFGGTASAVNVKTPAEVSKEAVKEQAKYAQPNPEALKGGSINIKMDGEPPSVHPITSQDYSADQIKMYVMDSLLAYNQNTYEWESRVAEKWEISKDKKVFTFRLRKNNTFSDGHQLTAEDVKFSFDAIFEPKYKAANMRPYFESIEKVEALDPYTVKVTAKDTYFLNFSSIATMYILPKHIYSDIEKSEKMTRTLIGSGPYVLEKFDKGQKIVLKRNEKWFGFSKELHAENWKGYYNFDQINFRFVKEENVAVEMMKKGDFDYMEFRSPEVYVQKTQGEPWGKTVFKNEAENAVPKFYGFIGFNFKKEIFKDKRVRLALSHLMNREEMNKKFRYDLSYLATGPQYVQSDYASPNVKPIPYDPKLAMELLTKAGWSDKEKKGILQKNINGKPVEFRFTLIHAGKDREKYWTMYREDLKKVGIDMEIRLLEWNSFLKITEENVKPNTEASFDAFAMGWSTTVEWDPKSIWHSKSATEGGLNVINYKNPDLDKLIDKARNEVDRSKRIKMLHRVYEMIAADAPYIFMFNDKFNLYANSDKVVKTGPTMKYDVGMDIWTSVNVVKPTP